MVDVLYRFKNLKLVYGPEIVFFYSIALLCKEEDYVGIFYLQIFLCYTRLHAFIINWKVTLSVTISQLNLAWKYFIS